jgi:hypothetical protein
MPLFKQKVLEFIDSINVALAKCSGLIFTKFIGSLKVML